MQNYPWEAPYICMGVSFGYMLVLVSVLVSVLVLVLVLILVLVLAFDIGVGVGIVIGFWHLCSNLCWYSFWADIVSAFDMGLGQLQLQATQ